MIRTSKAWRFALALAAAASLAIASPCAAAAQETDEPAGPIIVLGHPVFVFECSDTGFSPKKVTAVAVRSAIFIRNLSTVAQSYTVTRKRDGAKKVIFRGDTIAGQSITGTTKFRTGDVFIIKETITGAQAKITVE
jgi:hypothetical protein